VEGAAPAVAQVCLAVAAAWQAAIMISDDRQRSRASGRTYRSGLGWTDPATLDRWRRSHPVALAAAVGLLLALALPSVPGAVLAAACCAAVIAGVLRDGGYTSIRFAPLCLTMLAASLLLHRLGQLVGPLIGPVGPVGEHTGALLASFCAAQLYLVAGIRKLRSRQFLTGRVILDSVAYGTAQAAAGSREFLPLLRPDQLATLVVDRRVQLACRGAAVAATVAELALGLGAVGLGPAVATLILAVLSHLAFLLVSPLRIAPFTIAAVGLLFLASHHPILAGVV
jgi:hypothetical protein